MLAQEGMHKSDVACHTPLCTGLILDSVIGMDRNAFERHIWTYLLLSVATGFFGGIRNLCVSIVGRKLNNEVRNRLFSALMVQDIAFFDGNRFGGAAQIGG